MSSKDTVLWTAAAAAGFYFFLVMSHPKSKVKKRIRPYRYGNIDLLPNVRIYKEDKVYHLHHWLNLSSLFFLLHNSRRRRILGSKLMRGFILGGIVQGLCYKDRFKIVTPLAPLSDTTNEEKV